MEMLWNLYSFIVLYAILLVAEVWLLGSIFGDRMESLPHAIRAVVTAIVLGLPAFVAYSIDNAPTVITDQYGGGEYY